MSFLHIKTVSENTMTIYVIPVKFQHEKSSVRKTYKIVFLYLGNITIITIIVSYLKKEKLYVLYPPHNFI